MAIVKRKPTVKVRDINPERRQRPRSDSDSDPGYLRSKVAQALEVVEDAGRYTVYYARRGVSAGLDLTFAHLKWIIIALLFYYLWTSTADYRAANRLPSMKGKYPCGLGGISHPLCSSCGS